MLTLNFANELTPANAFTSGNHFYVVGRRLHPFVNMRFSPMKGESLFMINANPDLHKKGTLHFSTDHAFIRRGVSIPRLKEAVESSPVAMQVSMFEGSYCIGKGFIAKVINRGMTTDSENKLEILFAVTSKVGKTVTSPDELKIYIHRELYNDMYKRLMSALKPYLSNHKGDIIVTNSINNYLIYNYSIPNFRDIDLRMRFEANMKELFFRSIKFTKWRKDEDDRIAKQEAEEAERKAREERERKIQERMMNIIMAEQARIEESIVIPEVVEELPLVGEQVDHMSFQDVVLPTQVVGQITTQQIEAWAQRILDENTLRSSEQLMEALSSEEPAPQPEVTSVRARRRGRTTSAWMDLVEQNTDLSGQITTPPQSPSPMDGVQATEVVEQFSQPQQQQEPLSTPQMEEVNGVGSIPQEELQQSLADIPTSFPQSSAIEEVSEEEIMRLMDQFSINPNEISYSVTLDPVTQEPTVVEEYQTNADGEPIAQEVNEETIIVFDNEEGVSNEDYLNEVRERNEEELDNDPNAYQEAEVVEDEDPYDEFRTREEVIHARAEAARRAARNH